MNFIYFDGSSGLSGDMILGALLDIGADREAFLKHMGSLGLRVEIRIHEVKRSSLRGLKVDVKVDKSAKGHGRHWADIEKLIQESLFTTGVKERALKIFKNLFTAEARVHGHEFHKTHLHEAGADDAIIDIVGASYLIEKLDITHFLSSPLNVGSGWVQSSHGILPVPPPAVAELLKKVPIYSAWVENELVTPTGAAIISSLVQDYSELPEIVYEKLGCGAGGRDFKDFPNILRIYYGSRAKIEKGKKVFVIEANIDDANPQLLGHFFETAFTLGALDVSMTPIVMKKNRPGTKLTILTEAGTMDAIIRAVFTETTSIGVRFHPVGRHTLDRRIKKVTVMGEEIEVKVAYFEGRQVNIQPEFEDCLKAARKKGVPVKKVIEEALSAFIPD